MLEFFSIASNNTINVIIIQKKKYESQAQFELIWHVLIEYQMFANAGKSPLSIDQYIISSNLFEL